MDDDNAQGLEPETNVIDETQKVDLPPAGHPAWQEILNELPDEFHSLLTPKLEAWDKSVQDKLQAVRTEFEPLNNYKEFVDNGIDLDTIRQSLGLAQQFQADPAVIVAQAIEAFGLQFAPISSPSADASNPEEEFNYGDDIVDHPIVKQLLQKVEELGGKFEQDATAKNEAQQIEEFEGYLENLRTAHGDFDNTYVTSMMANGMRGEDAVKMYQETINAAVLKATNGMQAPKEQPPVVMGADGQTGSGIPETAVRMGDLKKGQLEDMVMQMLENAAKDT